MKSVCKSDWKKIKNVVHEYWGYLKDLGVDIVHITWHLSWDKQRKSYKKAKTCFIDIEKAFHRIKRERAFESNWRNIEES